jgi:protoporphyrinogen oxidase
MTDVETLIVGAGISGLATAASIGRGGDLLLLEADAAIGGYCKTVKRDGFVWDYSGHFFHFKHAEIEAWLRARMPGQDIRTVVKKSFISYAGKQIDFPFQKNIHQLPQAEFIDCLYDLYMARGPGMPAQPEGNFKEMLYARFGRSIAEKFLIPYNEKLYATDLATLDRDAMGRFFPHADLTDIVKNMRQADNASYNASFTYPAGGAIEYVNALASEVEPSALKLNEPVTAIDLERKVARTPKGEYRYRNLVTSVPFPALMALCGRPVDERVFTWNQVLVFNLGFDAKGPKDVHWVYFPDRSRAFYRIGFYDNIFDGPRMSLYVELGFPRGAHIDVGPAGGGRALVGDEPGVRAHHRGVEPAGGASQAGARRAGGARHRALRRVDLLQHRGQHRRGAAADDDAGPGEGVGVAHGLARYRGRTTSAGAAFV